MGRKAAGAALIVASLVLPPLVWSGGRAVLAVKAAHDPVPDQGGMVLVYLGSWAAVAAAVGLGTVGLILLLRR